MQMTLTHTVRDKMGLPPISAVHPNREQPGNPHFHLYIEKGWNGAYSPRLSLREAQAIVTNFFQEPFIENHSAESTYFPFTLVFFKVKGQEEGYRFVLKECNGKRVFQNNGWNGQRCNDTEDWR